MKTEQTEINHALQNAKGWTQSISEMVRALDRDTAAEDWVESLSSPQLEKVMEEQGLTLPEDTEDDEKPSVCRELILNTMQRRFGTDPDGFDFNEDEARERIHDAPLSVQVRSGWETPGQTLTPSEFEVLLSTGGPALRLRGELDEHNQPDRVWMEYQDWGTPWTQYFDVEQGTLLAFCREFWFGE